MHYSVLKKHGTRAPCALPRNCTMGVGLPRARNVTVTLRQLVQASPPRRTGRELGGRRAGLNDLLIRAPRQRAQPRHLRLPLLDPCDSLHAGGVVGVRGFTLRVSP